MRAERRRVARDMTTGQLVRPSGQDGSVSVVSELEGTLLKDGDPFPYFMLVAFEASGLARFAALLLLWPALRLLRAAGKVDVALRVMVFVAVAGVRESEVEAVGRAVLPKFLMDDVDVEAWRAFVRSSAAGKRVVVTKLPRVTVEWFVRAHLCADVVVGPELQVSRHGVATGFLERVDDDDHNSSAADPVQAAVLQQFKDADSPAGALARPTSSPDSFSTEQRHLPPFAADVDNLQGNQLTPTRPVPVVFHDGRLVRRPTAATALLTILWMPLGILLAFVRIAVGVAVPLRFLLYFVRALGGEVVVRGRQPRPPKASTCSSGGGGGVLFVCTHRSLMDPVVLALVLGRRVPAVTYSISRLSEVLSPIPTVRLSRDRRVDAGRIRAELARGDLAVCPEGTTCREPFLLRFSALFAELTDRIVPVAMNYRVGFFHATTARGWKALDPVFFFMNPRPAYEVTFLEQLPAEKTCSAGKRSPHDVANEVQRILAATLGFECTNLTRKDKYRVLAGNDGTVPPPPLTELLSFIKLHRVAGEREMQHCRTE